MEETATRERAIGKLFKGGIEGSDLSLVSVITPSYGQGRFIEETILSVKRQEYPHIEHIIVDGGSRDETLEVLGRYEGTYNMRWISEPDRGMYEAVNKGLRMSQGEILAYLNSDDRYFPWTVRVAVNALTEHPEVDFVFGDMVNVEEETKSIRLYLFPHFRLGYIRRSGYLGQPSVFWRRSVFARRGGFDESLKYVADCDYWMRVGALHRWQKVHEVLALERDHPQAKRLARAEQVNRELASVRSRYVPLCGFRFRLISLLDRCYQILWCRSYLVLFLFQYLLVRGRFRLPGSPRWSHFLGMRAVQVSWPHALLTLVPFTRGRFSRGMVSLNRKTVPGPIFP